MAAAGNCRPWMVAGSQAIAQNRPILLSVSVPFRIVVVSLGHNPRINSVFSMMCHLSVIGRAPHHLIVKDLRPSPLMPYPGSAAHGRPPPTTRNQPPPPGGIGVPLGSGESGSRNKTFEPCAFFCSAVCAKRAPSGLRRLCTFLTFRVIPSGSPLSANRQSRPCKVSQPSL